jgi:hypothetical protein
MPAENRPALASLVIQWPHDVAADETVRTLVDKTAETPTTWAVESRVQVLALQALAPSAEIEFAALACERPMLAVRGGDAATDWTATVANQLDSLRSAGVAVTSVQFGAKPGERHSERRLQAMGVRSILSSGGGPAVRPLPYGLWQFAPQVSTPRVRRWPRLFAVRPKLDLDGAAEQPAIAAVDVGALAAKGASRSAWREVDAVLSQFSAARREQSVQVVTVAEAASTLAGNQHSRPQRSILRAA